MNVDSKNSINDWIASKAPIANYTKNISERTQRALWEIINRESFPKLSRKEIYQKLVSYFEEYEITQRELSDQIVLMVRLELLAEELEA